MSDSVGGTLGARGTSWARLLVAAILGSVAFALIDSLIGLSTPGTALLGGVQHILFFLLPLQHCVTLGVGVGGALALLHAVFGKPVLPFGRSPRASLLLFSGGVAYAAFVLWSTSELFAGGWMSRQSWRPIAEWGFKIVAVGMIPLLGLWVVRTVALTSKARALAGMFWLLLGGGLLWVNARVYRNQYPGLHLCLSGTALLVLALGVHGAVLGPWLRRARGRWVTVGVILAASCVIFGPFVLGRIERFGRVIPRVRAAVENRVWGLAQLSFLTHPLLHRPDTSGTETPDVEDLLHRLVPQLGTKNGEDSQLGPGASRRDLMEALNRKVPKRGELNVLWIALDTVRADHVGFLGYGRKTTPVLDTLAKDAVVFEQARTPYPTSAYAYSGMFASLPARISPHYALAFRRPWKYPAGQVFPELLRLRGYRTAAVSAFNEKDLDNPMMFKSLRAGFQVFNPDQAPGAANAAAVTDSARGVLQGFARDSSSPFHLWVHYLDAHDPYDHHAEFDFGPSALDCYDSEIAFLDYHVGRLIAELAKLDLLDSTMIVVFSDHGEEFDEHGGRYHNGTVYDEQIHVPLLIRVPGLSPQRVTGTVSLMDVVPTCLEVLGISDDAPRMGRSLVPALFGQPLPEGGFAYSEVFTVRAGVHARDERTVIVGQDKLIRRVQKDVFELYALGRDPRERDSNLGLGRPEEGRLKGVLKGFDAAIAQWVSEREESGGPRFAKELTQLLEAAVLARDAESVRRTSQALENALVTGYGDPHQRLVAELLPQEIDAVFSRVMSRWDDFPPRARPAILRILMHRSDPGLLALFGSQLTSDLSTAVPAAAALALRGDDSGRAVLLRALSDATYPDKSDIAWALTRLGDSSAREWLELNLLSCLFGRPLREGVSALSFLRSDDLAASGERTPARLLRTRIFDEAYRHPEVNATIIEACQKWPEEDASLILLRLARDLDIETRRLAQEALTERMDEESLAKNRAAMDEAMDGDAALLNILPDVAIKRYEKALELGTTFNARVRFQLAQAHRLGHDAAKARELLRQLQENAPLVYDRRLARRYQDHLAFGAFVDDPKFRCSVLEATAPDLVRRGDLFAVRFKLRNDGTEPWFGGWSSGTPELHLRFILEDEKLYETQVERNLVNHFPERGVHPGESVEILVLGVGMRRSPEGTLALYFRNERVAYPNHGLVWKHTAPSRME